MVVCLRTAWATKPQNNKFRRTSSGLSGDCLQHDALDKERRLGAGPSGKVRASSPGSGKLQNGRRSHGTGQFEAGESPRHRLLVVGGRLRLGGKWTDLIAEGWQRMAAISARRMANWAQRSGLRVFGGVFGKAAFDGGIQPDLLLGGESCDLVEAQLMLILIVDQLKWFLHAAPNAGPDEPRQRGFDASRRPFAIASPASFPAKAEPFPKLGSLAGVASCHCRPKACPGTGPSATAGDRRRHNKGRPTMPREM